MNKSKVNDLMGKLGDEVSKLVMTKEQADNIRKLFMEIAFEVNG